MPRLLLPLLCLVATSAAAQAPSPPVALREPHPVVRHGERLVDDYFWMRDPGRPELRAYLDAENAYTEAALAPARALQERLLAETLARLSGEGAGPAFLEGGYRYYSRSAPGLRLPLLCRREGGLGGREEVLLDLNALPGGSPGLGTFALGDGGRRLAYSVDAGGSRDYALYVKDLRTGRVGPALAQGVTTVAWAAGDRALFYVTEDAARRPHRLWRHAPGGDDALIYEERDERFSLSVRRSRSGELLVIESASLTATEVRVLRARDPAAAPALVAAREDAHEYEVDDHGAHLYIRTNLGAPDFRLMRAPLASPGRGHWRELIPHRPGVTLARVEVFRGHLVLLEREDGLPRLSVADLDGDGRRRVPVPEALYSLRPDENPEWGATRYRFRYQSPLTPPSVYEFDLRTGRSDERVWQAAAPAGFDRARYRAERVQVEAPDGAQVPVSLVYRRGLARDGTAALVLRGYGAYGVSQPAAFSAEDLALLDRGVVLATAHVRGGGELGRAWRDAGRLRRKMQSFTDFIAAAEGLVRLGYASPARLAAEGASAGGLLIAAAINLRPDLFRAAALRAPFVDVINTMSDPALPLTVGDYEEWGDPKDAGDYASMRAWCPYSNLSEQAYPALLVSASAQDTQVMPWEAAKYVARLRALNRGGRPVLLRTGPGGHGGALSRAERLADAAFTQAFLLTQLGVEPQGAQARPDCGAGCAGTRRGRRPPPPAR